MSVDVMSKNKVILDKIQKLENLANGTSFVEESKSAKEMADKLKLQFFDKNRYSIINNFGLNENEDSSDNSSYTPPTPPSQPPKAKRKPPAPKKKEKEWTRADVIAKTRIKSFIVKTYDNKEWRYWVARSIAFIHGGVAVLEYSNKKDYSRKGISFDSKTCIRIFLDESQEECFIKYFEDAQKVIDSKYYLPKWMYKIIPFNDYEDECYNIYKKLPRFETWNDYRLWDIYDYVNTKKYKDGIKEKTAWLGLGEKTELVEELETFIYNIPYISVHGSYRLVTNKEDDKVFCALTN